MYEGSLVPEVGYMDDVYSVAFADSSISFYSSRDVMSPQLLVQIPVEEEIRSVVYSGPWAGVVVTPEAGVARCRMDLYQPDGKLVFSREFSYDYDHVDIDGDWIFLYNENSCRIYNRYGNLKYEGTFDFTVSKITKGRLPGEIIVTGPQMIQQIKLH